MASALLEGRVLAGHCMKAVGCACASQRDQCNHSHGVPKKIAFCACNSPGATHCPFFSAVPLITRDREYEYDVTTIHARARHATCPEATRMRPVADMKRVVGQVIA